MEAFIIIENGARPAKFAILTILAEVPEGPFHQARVALSVCNRFVDIRQSVLTNLFFVPLWTNQIPPYINRRPDTPRSARVARS
jgi:hypothetical protein